jgi:hypothetical protein
MDPRSSPTMYRLVDAIRVKRPSGIYWTLTFAPILPLTGSRDESPRQLVVTVPDSRHATLEGHAPSFTREEIAAMESPRDARPRPASPRGRSGGTGARSACSLAWKASEDASGPPAIEVAERASDPGTLLRAGTAQQRKALFRLLVKELRVMSRDKIPPTYRIPALVRASDGPVDPRGLGTTPLTWPNRCSRVCGLCVGTERPY